MCGGGSIKGGQVWLDVRWVTHAPHARVTHVHPAGPHAPWTLATVLQGVCTTQEFSVRNMDPVVNGVCTTQEFSVRNLDPVPNGVCTTQQFSVRNMDPVLNGVCTM